MNVVQDLEALLDDLQERVENGDESCRPLLQKVEADLKQARQREDIRRENRET
ncbi:hypothetical protein ACFFK0_15475 [Paenibacillus chartarius]|uniref:Uncharacterized protein n=1 Tax=Paenibacillus chartarius TaxID=747481 RepID=A0ABV6DMF1_9BACL